MSTMPSQFELRVEQGYEQQVVIGHDALSLLGSVWPESAARAVIVADQRVFALHGDRLSAALAPLADVLPAFTFPPGEPSKSRAVAVQIEDQLLEVPIRRNDVVVAFGGGVATDLVGYVASRLLRGVSLINVPTTVMAMVDAALGGKTAIDVPAGKNLLGTFYWPRTVIGDPRWLATLPVNEIRSGLAEVVKHAVIEDVGLLDRLEELSLDGAPSPDALAELMARAAAVKVGVVRSDPFERGRRRVLNFGHTVAHGIEAALGYALSHGEAVAIGMAVEGRVAERRLGFPAGDRQRLLDVLRHLGLPVEPPVRFTDAVAWMQRDKKNLDASVRVSLPRSLGEMEPADGLWSTSVPLEELEECWYG